MKQPVVLATPRLELVPLDAAHLDELHSILLDDHVRRYLMDGESVARDFCERELETSQAMFRERGVGLWMVRLVGESEFCGFGSFRVFSELHSEPQLTYAFLPAYVGGGLATELGTELVRHVRAAGWQTVHSAVDAPNVASARVLEKLGFRAAGSVPGAFGDTWLYELCLSPQRLEERQNLARLPRQTLPVAMSWDGAVRLDHGPELALEFSERELVVEATAPFHGDPAPMGAPGPYPHLWEHEVVELFLLGAEERYLEVELSPHGHYLVLSLMGRRQIAWQGAKMHYAVQRQGGQWHGHARIPLSWLPPGLRWLNAYAINGAGDQRRYWAYRPCPGSRPDFHRLESFAPLVQT